MCTVIACRAADTLVGRNLDLEYSLGERVTLLPRRAPFVCRQTCAPTEGFAVMGMAYMPHEQPLFYDALNEKGVYMAGLNFPLWATYAPADSPDAVAPFELIPYVLRQCATAREAADLLLRTTVAAVPYSEELALTPLHWFLCDGAESFAVEPLCDGLHVEPNAVDVLTNSPPLSYHQIRLADFTALQTDAPPAAFGDVPTPLYSRGMGGLGLPGDFSSSSRFVRAAFMRCHAPWLEGDAARAHTLRMLSCVSFPKGCVRVGERDEITVYSSCCALREGRYSYITYEDFTIRSIAFDEIDTDGDRVVIVIR